MNDESEQFEQRLRQQPLRQIPEDWRASILQAAQSARIDGHPVRPARNRFDWLRVIRRELIFSLWPNSKGWAGVAAVWVLIAVFNFATRDSNADAPVRADVTSAQRMADLKLQQRFLAELASPVDSTDADRQKNSFLKPHSQHIGFRGI